MEDSGKAWSPGDTELQDLLQTALQVCDGSEVMKICSAAGYFDHTWLLDRYTKMVECTVSTLSIHQYCFHVVIVPCCTAMYLSHVDGVLRACVKNPFRQIIQTVALFRISPVSRKALLLEDSTGA